MEIMKYRGFLLVAPLFFGEPKIGITFGDMGFINLHIHVSDRETIKLLKEVNCKLDKILAGNNDTAAIVKATEDLDAAGNKLKSAVEKNKPQ